jgi:N-acetylmuramoyl-L-alanine amidase
MRGDKMSRSGFIGIIIFFLLSTLCLGVLVFLLGTFYLDAPPKSEAADASLPKYTTVIIDAGHGGEDGGASSAAGLVEKDVNLDIAKQLAEMLRASGINVIMTREDDKLLYDRNVDFHGRKKKLDMAARLNVMQNSENAIFISIHMNSYTNPKYSGLQVWYSQNNADSAVLANLIQSSNQMYLQPENKRKTKGATSAIFLLNEAPCPAVLVECGFLSNADEAAKFESEGHRQRVALLLCSSILDFLYTKQEDPQQ